MRVSWAIADNFADLNVDPDKLTDIGSTWGSWRTWRAWNTDNVLCCDGNKTKDLIARAFQAVCNLYIKNSHFAEAGRPMGVNLFEGEYTAEFDNQEEVITLHLLASQNDIVLLLGYNVEDCDSTDQMQKHKRTNYLNAMYSVCKMNEDVQWVFIDYPTNLPERFDDLENVTCDSFENVLELLS